MANYLESNLISNELMKEHCTEHTIMRLRQSGELLRSRYHVIEAQLFEIDPQKESKKRIALRSLALKVIKLAESVTECADEFQIFLDKEA